MTQLADRQASHQLAGVSQSRQAWLTWLIVISGLLLLMVAVFSGNVYNLLFLLAAVFFTLYSLRCPLPALFVSMLVGTQFFQLVPFENMPGVRGPGFTLNLSDLFVLLFLLVAAYRLPRRQGHLMFGSFVLIWVAYIGARFALNLLIGEASLKLSLNLARYQVGWLGYTILVSAIETPRDLRRYVNFVLLMMVIATGFQVVEAIQGQRLNLFGLGTNEYWTGTKYLVVEGRFVPYLWTRALSQTLMALFFSMGCVLEGVRTRRYLPLALLAVLGILIAAVRAWYFGLAVGVLALLVFQKTHSRAAFRAGIALLALIVIVAGLSSLMVKSYGGSPWTVWLARAADLLTFSKEPNFVGRVDQAKLAWTAIRDSLLLGYGWGSMFVRLQAETGVNTLLLHGFVGTALILGLYIIVGWRVFRLWSQLPPSQERGFMAGLLALMVLYLAVLFSQDTLSSGSFAVTAAAFVDRISSFQKADLIEAEE